MMSEKTQILLAEDEAMLRVLAVEMLGDSGFQVFEAGDGVDERGVEDASGEAETDDCNFDV